MPSTIVAKSREAQEKKLIEQWTRSASQTELGLLDLVVLDEWIAQLAPDGGPGSPE